MYILQKQNDFISLKYARFYLNIIVNPTKYYLVIISKHSLHHENLIRCIFVIVEKFIYLFNYFNGSLKI